MLIVQEREELSPQVCARLPEMLFRDSSRQAALDEIVGADDISRQRAGVTTQPRDLRLYHFAEIVHEDPFVRPMRGST